MSHATDPAIRLMIVDDQPLIRRGLALMLGSEAGIKVVGKAEDGQQAIDLALNLTPDVIIMDLQMPGVSGVVATREITAQLPATRVVILTTFDRDDLVFEAIRAGAQAYLLKDATETQVLETVRAVHRGESYLSPTIARKVMSQFRTLSTTARSASQQPAAADVSVDPSEEVAPGHASASSEQPLSDKEELILALLAEGKTNKQIATSVHLAEGTVKNYVSRIMEKLHAQSRTELAVRAVGRRR